MEHRICSCFFVFSKLKKYQSLNEAFQTEAMVSKYADLACTSSKNMY